MRSLSQLEKLLAIDKDDLDTELVRQPQLFYEVSELMVEAVANRDRLKDALGVTEAQVAAAVRDRLSRQEVKVTEGLVREEIALDAKTLKAQHEFQEAKHAADQAQQLREAFIQRSFMLRDLASLYVAGYYTQGAVRGASQGEFSDHQYQQHKNRIDQSRKQLKKGA